MLYYILVFQFRIPIIPDFPLSGWQDGLVSGKGGPTKKRVTKISFSHSYNITLSFVFSET